MKKLIIGAMSVATIFAVSCKKDVVSPSADKPLILSGTADPDTLVGNISVNTTVTRTTYIQGIVFVDSGATLTINAGVTLIGSPGGVGIDTVNLENNKGTVVVSQGCKIVANGTATSPIVWTSSKAVGSRSYGDWGGLVVLGKAPIKTTTCATTNAFEGLNVSNPHNKYGGTDPNDNSGSVTYNRFEFGGGAIYLPNQEINGVTLCGVGRGTTFHHVEVSNAGDDGFEFFGGTINVHHLLSYGNKDDDFDFDEMYQGDLQFIIGFRNDLCDNSGSHMIELDGNASANQCGDTTKGHTNPFIANATLIGPRSLVARAGSGGHFDGGVYVRRVGRIKLANSYIQADSFPAALGVTPTTRNPIDNICPSCADHSYIVRNVWQTGSAHTVVWDNDEGNDIVDGTAFLDPDNPLITILGGGPQNLNTAVVNPWKAFPVTPGDIKLDGALKPQAGSALLAGGLALNGIDPFFVGTTQRGAVISTDPWTTTGTWISIAIN